MSRKNIEKFIEDNFDWNIDYILNNRLSIQKIRKSGIQLYTDEFFVKFPNWRNYYISQYGRLISCKNNKLKLLKHNNSGTNKDYLNYKLSDQSNNRERTITENRAVAEVFCPNFWGINKKLEAHHIDGNRSKNFYRNIILLPTDLHHKLHEIKRIVLFEGRRIIEYENILDLIRDTDLTLEQVILARYDKKRKPLKSSSKYTVYNIEGHKIGFQYYKKENVKSK